MITEKMLEMALATLQHSSEKHAEARAARLYAEKFLPVKLALLAKKHVGMSVAAANSAALSDPEYIELLRGWKAAVERDEQYRFERSAAETVIEAWRTEQATIRSEHRAFA